MRDLRGTAGPPPDVAALAVHGPVKRDPCRAQGRHTCPGPKSIASGATKRVPAPERVAGVIQPDCEHPTGRPVHRRNLVPLSECPSERLLCRILGLGRISQDDLDEATRTIEILVEKVVEGANPDRPALFGGHSANTTTGGVLRVQSPTESITAQSKPGIFIMARRHPETYGYGRDDGYRRRTMRCCRDRWGPRRDVARL